MSTKWASLAILSVLFALLGGSSPSVSAEPDVSFSVNAYALPGGVVLNSSPALADLDGDGEPEVLVGTTGYNGQTGQHDRPMRLVALKGDGSLLWSYDAGAPINSTPAVGDLDGDGQPEIVVGVGGDPADTAHQGGVVALSRNGQERWRFTTQDLYEPHGYADGVFSSPSLCDVEGDGRLEVAFGAWDQHIYLLDYQGRSLWNNVPGVYQGTGFMNGDTVWSSPACSDLNGDGLKEIIIGSDIARGGILPDGTRPDSGGFIYVLNMDGQILARRHLPESIYSSPAVGDLDGDGSYEIVVGTSYYYWQRGQVAQPYVYAFGTREVFGPRHYADPAKLPHLPGWPRPTMYPGFSSPTLADLDGDEDLEIVIGSGRDSGASEPGGCRDAGSCYGALYAWHHTGQPVSGFPMWPKDSLDKNAFIRSSPTVVDIDNDGALEILVAMLWDVIVVGPTGQQERLLHTTWTVDATPAVGDADGDGLAEVWIGGGNYDRRHQGHLWRFEQSSGGVGTAAWPMFRHDIQHTAHYGPSAALIAGESLTVLHPTGESAPATGTMTLRLAGGAATNWRVASKPAGVTVTPSSGQLSPNQQVTLTVQINPAGRGRGQHNLGQIVLEGTTTTGEAVEPLGVSLTLVIGDVSSLYLPSIRK